MRARKALFSKAMMHLSTMQEFTTKTMAIRLCHAQAGISSSIFNRNNVTSFWFSQARNFKVRMNLSSMLLGMACMNSFLRQKPRPRSTLRTPK